MEPSETDAAKSCCPICLLGLPDARAALPCGHSLCTECLITLTRRSPNVLCPLCRAPSCHEQAGRDDDADDDGADDAGEPYAPTAIRQAAWVATRIVRKISQPTLDMALSTAGGPRSLCFLVAFLAADLAARPDHSEASATS